jgi:3-oxoacyl-[acyl-carrier protein] reductase
MLKNEKVLVVGGSGDIGLALCRELLEKDATVEATWCTNPAGLENLKNEWGDKLIISKLDVRDTKACETFGDELESKSTIPSCFIYNAGVMEDVPILGMTDEQWKKVLDINVTGALNVIRSVVKYMSLERKGKVFLVSSVAATKGGRGQGNYAASKAALEALGRSLAVELARKNIMVNMIAPGVIESAMTKDVMARAKEKVLDNITLGRAGKPEEVARFICHLCSSEITYITGQTFFIDGGFKL